MNSRLKCKLSSTINISFGISVDDSYTTLNVEENVLPLNPTAGKRKIYLDLAKAGFPFINKCIV